MKKLMIILAAMALVTAGCATAMVPVGGNAYRSGTMAVDVIVGQKFPTFHRSDPFTPIHVTIRNNTPQKVQLKYSYFSLIDPAGREYVIASAPNVVDWLRYERWSRYYGPYYPQPIGRYVFREGRLDPGAEIQAVIFFHQATHYGQGTYTLMARIPENRQPLEHTFRLK